MDTVIVYWYWWILAAIFTILELLLPGVFFLWLAIPALLIGGLLMLFPLNLEWQLFLFTVLAALSVLAGRRLVKRFGAEESDQPLLNQRMAQYVGRTYVVSEAIVNGGGRVRIGDTSWRAEGPDTPVGGKVKVTGAVGTTLQVTAAGKDGISGA